MKSRILANLLTRLECRAALAAALLGIVALCPSGALAVTQNYYGTSGALSGNVWSTNPAGPYTSAFNTASGGGVMNFDTVGATQVGGANTIVVAGISATQSFSITGSPSGTISNTGNAVIPITVGTGATLDFGTQAFTTSATAGYTMTGPGVLALLGGTYGGGFTLNSGTVIVRGVNAMGSAGTNTLTINGGTIAANATRDLSNKFAGGINVGGNFTLGDATGLALTTANLTFNNNVNLGAAARTINIGANGSYTFSGVVDNGSLVIDAVSGATGRVILLGQNTYSGGTTVKTGATLSTNGISSTGVGPITSGPLGTGDLTIDGGTFIPTSSVANNIANNITLNAVAGNSIAVGGGPATLSGNITGPGGVRKGSSGQLILTGANNYAGTTTIDSGFINFGKTQSLYNGNTANWTSSFLTVNTGGGAIFAVGGTGLGEFTMADFDYFASGAGSAAFLDGSSVGVDTTNSGDQTISTVFTNNANGKLGLAKAGTSTLFLTAANTHEGPTTVLGGTLNLSNQLAVQNSTLTLSGGTVAFDQSVVGSAFTAGGLAGNTALTLMNTAAGAVGLTVGGNNATTTYSGAIASVSGSSLTKVGTGALTLSGNNAYDGGTTLSGGTLNINHASALGFGQLVINPGTTIDNTTGANIALTNNTPQTWNGNFTYTGTRALSFGTGAVTMTADTQITIPAASANNNALTINGVISGNFVLTRAGTGRSFITGQNTFSGMNITGGAVVHVGDQSSNLVGGTGPVGIGVVSISGGQLIGSSGTAVNTIENNIVLTGPNTGNSLTTNGTMTLSGVLSGTGGFNKTGNATSFLVLTNANTFSGDTGAGSATSGTITLANQLALQNSTLTTGQVVFDQTVVGNAFTLGGVSGNFNLALQNNASVAVDLTIGNNNADTAHNGSLTGPGSIIKVGTGKTALDGANGYAGTTTVNAGTLLVNGSHTGGGAYSVASGAKLGGTGSIGSSVAISAGGILGPGASVGTLTVDSVNLDGKLQIEFDGDVDTIDKLIVTGALDIAGSTVDFDNLGVGSLNGGPHIFASYGSLLGTFTVVDLPSGYSINYDYLGTKQIALTSSAHPGDFDSDGDVDGADFVAWQTNFPKPTGATLAQGDADGDGDVDGADFVVWQTNFPFTPGPGAAPVPEPGAVCLAICGIVGLGILRWRCASPRK